MVEQALGNYLGRENAIIVMSILEWSIGFLQKEAIEFSVAKFAVQVIAYISKKKFGE